MDNFTHFNSNGEAHMVNISDKDVTKRVAVATGTILMLATTLNAIKKGEHKKGDVLGVARLAGIMASKKTADLIPLCHPLSISSVDISFAFNDELTAVDCTSRLEIKGCTGVEMEALTAVQIALLTIYDMCKSNDRGMIISNIRLLEKSGGKSGHWKRNSPTEI